MTTAKTDPANLVVEHWPVADLVPYAKNAKKHTPESTRKLAGVIRARGHWTAPIVVRAETKEVINGHGRRLAALHLGMKTVPVVVLHGLTDAEADALRLSDNQVSNQDYDTDLLRQGLSALAETGGIDMDNLGFDEKELDFLVEDPGEMLEDAFVEDIGEAVEEQKTENDAQAA
uniref:ParB/Srx family N-terminal domain-containing protein n=1 Tax=Methylobacterium sp. B34 TaxID=95563 RepID=UPI00067969CA